MSAVLHYEHFQNHCQKVTNKIGANLKKSSNYS